VPKSLTPAARPATRLLDTPAPSGQGLFERQPLGVVLHGSRSGRRRTPAEEFDSTVAWAIGGAGGLGWHATVGEGVAAIHLPPTVWAWHARRFSGRYLGLEFAQARRGDPISDGQVTAAAHYLAMVVRPAWPGLDLTRPGVLVEHWQLDRLLPRPDGKTDVAPERPGELAARIRGVLSAEC
jgi:hypothetical protein